MKPLLLLVLAAASAWPQALSVGVKAGVPLTDFFKTVTSPRFGFNADTKRYIIGPTVELRLPFGLAVEFDALYRRLNYEGSGTILDVLTNNRTTGNAWEFPLLLKYRLPTRTVRPFFDIGASWDTLSGVKQAVTRTVSGRATTETTSNPAELNKKTATGFVVGAGLDIHALLLHIQPEIRFTRWGSEHFSDPAGLLRWNRNQAEFLVGFNF
jgi:opacity protein-like surface antigen